MPLRRTAPPDPDVAARLVQLLPAVRRGWVLPAPDPGRYGDPAPPAGRAAEHLGSPAAEDPDDWVAAVGPAHQRLVEQARAAGQWGDEPWVGERVVGAAAGGTWTGGACVGERAGSSEGGVRPAATSWPAVPRSGERRPGEERPGERRSGERRPGERRPGGPGRSEPWRDEPGPAEPWRGERRPAERSGVGPGESSVLDLWRSGRVSPGRRGVLALGLVALLACLLTVFVVVRGRPQEVAVPAVVTAGVTVPGSAAAESPVAGDPVAGPEVVVAVGGRVRRPGIVRLPAGSRVDDAVRAAGGAVRPRDLALVNVARRLVDGEQVLVGVDAPEQPPAGAGAGAGAPGGPLDLNTATLPQLDALPGIGPVLAQRILDWRTEHGRFGSVDQLREVSGIGEATYADLQGEVRV